MDSGDYANLIYLGILLSALMFYVFVQFRGRMKAGLQQGIVWGLIFLAVIAAFGLWEDIQRDFSRQSVFIERGQIEVPRSSDGHYHLTLEVNDAPIEFIIDTGATDMVLSRQDAMRAGLKMDELRFLGKAQTANGTVATAPVTLDEVALGPYTDANVRARVNSAEMNGSLLGMRYLERFARLEIADDTLTLTR
ncbi:MAG: TIGR02281 family clan AA aspartic protease [Pseudomonadota bacterium]